MKKINPTELIIFTLGWDCKEPAIMFNNTKDGKGIDTGWITLEKFDNHPLIETVVKMEAFQQIAEYCKLPEEGKRDQIYFVGIVKKPRRTSFKPVGVVFGKG